LTYTNKTLINIRAKVYLDLLTHLFKTAAKYDLCNILLHKPL